MKQMNMDEFVNKYQALMQTVTHLISSDVTTLVERYETTLPELAQDVTKYEDEVKGYLKEMGFASTEDVLRNLGLFTNEGELKNAAILLFGKNVCQSFPSANFKIGRFHTDESDLIIQDDVEGNIMQMANRVMELLRSRYLISPIHYEGMLRIEQLEVPEKALRELIYNAISHKDYTGPAIQMRVYDRSIELWNFGLLPEQLTPATLLQQHSSYPRNRNIANVFYKAGFVESWFQKDCRGVRTSQYAIAYD